MKAFLLTTLLLSVATITPAEKWSSPGDPYGPLEQIDLVTLQKFAVKSGAVSYVPTSFAVSIVSFEPIMYS